MKKKLLSIFLSIVIIVTLLCTSIYVKAEGNDEAGTSSESEEVLGMGEEDTKEKDIQLNEGEVYQDGENVSDENNLNPGDYDSNLFKIVLYTLGKLSDESIKKDELKAITKIDIEALQNEHSDLENIEIKSFSLLKEISNLKEINLGNVKCENIGELKEITTLEIVKVNGNVVEKGSLESVSEENIQEVTEPIIENQVVDNNEAENSEINSDENTSDSSVIEEEPSDEVIDNSENKEYTEEEPTDSKDEDKSNEGAVVTGDESENLPIIDANDKTINVGDKFDPLDGVTAKSNNGEDLTDKIEIKENEVNPNEQGKYKVTYYVKDNDNKEATKTISITVQKGEEVVNTLPIINAENKTIELGNKFNELDGIKAIDEEDGDITNDIIVVSSNVDVNKEGVYVVTYEIKDKDGGKTRKTIEVTVVKPLEKENEAPYINASDRTIKQGESFNPLNGVNAYDTEDGDLTSKIRVIENMVDISVVGKYSVTFEVSDSAGYRVTKEIYINVVPKSNTRPIIYADNITVALGEKYNPYAMVSASDKEDGDITGKIIVVYNYVNVYKEGIYKVGYKVTDSMGTSASCVIKVKVKNFNNGNKVTSTGDVPVIYCNDISIALDTKFNPLEWVAATDKEDGDITNKVMVIYNNVDTSIEGNYHVTYEIIDSNGNKVNKAMMVVVESEDKMSGENKPPIINANDITLEKGRYFDPLDGVTALDDEDGNLTNKIIVKENEVNVSKKGVYKVTYEVTDSKGLVTTKSISVTVDGGSGFNSNSTIIKIIIGLLVIITVSGSATAIIVNKKKK
ncbi:immunoglobulin-like domain-containing protein [Clostridium disporicum]|uniref:Discoidin domain-containing protein n=1 Tax=Clostridium disporicum TaxID=84024 RepID=A0A173ZVC6_9CLOT|nr:immunoglobulin-like domain-containing protein [Clostridium disporicum]CUN80251.1 discoidin domain-containing protein [Clostridium disporicum]